MSEGHQDIMLVQVLGEVRDSLRAFKVAAENCNMQNTSGWMRVPVKMFWAMIIGLFVLAGLNVLDVQKLIQPPVATVVHAEPAEGGGS